MNLLMYTLGVAYTLHRYPLAHTGAASSKNLSVAALVRGAASDYGRYIVKRL